MKFHFRRLLEADLEFLVLVRNECSVLLHDDRTFSLEDAVSWFRRTSPEFWLIEAGNVRIGYFRTAPEYPGQSRSLLLGADLHRDFRGRGFGLQAWCCFIDWVLESEAVSRLALEVLSNNHRALRLYQRLGFRHEGARRSALARQGVLVDSICMGMLREEWRDGCPEQLPKFDYSVSE